MGCNDRIQLGGVVSRRRIEGPRDRFQRGTDSRVYESRESNRGMAPKKPEYPTTIRTYAVLRRPGPHQPKGPSHPIFQGFTKSMVPRKDQALFGANRENPMASSRIDGRIPPARIVIGIG